MVWASIYESALKSVFFTVFNQSGIQLFHLQFQLRRFTLELTEIDVHLHVLLSLIRLDHVFLITVCLPSIFLHSEISTDAYLFHLSRKVFEAVLSNMLIILDYRLQAAVQEGSIDGNPTIPI